MCEDGGEPFASDQKSAFCVAANHAGAADLIVPVLRLKGEQRICGLYMWTVMSLIALALQKGSGLRYTIG